MQCCSALHCDVSSSKGLLSYLTKSGKLCLKPNGPGIYKTFHPQPKEYNLFLAGNKNFSKRMTTYMDKRKFQQIQENRINTLQSI